MPTKSTRPLKFTINDDVWTFRLLSKKQMRREHGRGYYGMTIIGKKSVDLRRKYLSMELLTHELFHIHAFYTFTDGSVNDDVQLEDVHAELFAHRGALILKQARKIFGRLK